MFYLNLIVTSHVSLCSKFGDFLLIEVGGMLGLGLEVNAKTPRGFLTLAFHETTTIEHTVLFADKVNSG